MAKLQCFRNLTEYYRITGNPEQQKLCFTKLVAKVCGEGLGIHRLELLKPRIIWTNNLNHRYVRARLIIARPIANGQTADYVLENVQVNCIGNEISCHLARHMLSSASLASI